MSVCPFAYLKNHTSKLHEISVHVSCSRGLTDDNVIYFRFLWLASCFHIVAPMEQNQTRCHVLSCSPGGSTGGDVWCLWLPCLVSIVIINSVTDLFVNKCDSRHSICLAPVVVCSVMQFQKNYFLLWCIVLELNWKEEQNLERKEMELILVRVWQIVCIPVLVQCKFLLLSFQFLSYNTRSINV